MKMKTEAEQHTRRVIWRVQILAAGACILLLLLIAARPVFGQRADAQNNANDNSATAAEEESDQNANENAEEENPAEEEKATEEPAPETVEPSPPPEEETGEAEEPPAPPPENAVKKTVKRAPVPAKKEPAAAPDTGLTPQEQQELSDIQKVRIQDMTSSQRTRRDDLLRKMREHLTKRSKEVPAPPEETPVLEPGQEPRMPNRLRRPATPPQPTEKKTSIEKQSQFIPETADQAALGEYAGKTYAFSLKDGSYVDLIESFSRKTGLPVLGFPIKLTGANPEESRITFFCEKLGFRNTLHQINDLLYKEVQPPLYLYLREDPKQASNTRFELYAFNELKQQIPIERVMESVEAVHEAVQAGKLLPSDVVRVFVPPKDTAEARAFTDMVSNMLDDYTQRALDNYTGRIDFTGRVDMLDKMISLIEQCSKMFRGEGNIERITVKYIKPSEAVAQLPSLVDNLEGESTQTPVVPRAPKVRQPNGTTELAPESERVLVVADDARKSLLVKGLPFKINEVREALKIIDIQHIEPEIPKNPVVWKLKHARAEDVAQTLTEAMKSFSNPAEAAVASRAPRRPGVPQLPNVTAADDQNLSIVVEPRQNALILQGPETLIQFATNFVDQYLDVEAGGNQFKKIPIKFQDPQVVADDVRSLMGTRSTSPRPKGTAVAAAEEPFNIMAVGDSVFVRGDPAQMSEAAALIEQIDVDSGQVSTYSIKLTNATPTFVVQILESIEQSSSSPSSDPAAAARNRIKQGTRTARRGSRFFPDDMAGMIYFTGTERDWEQDVRPTIEKIDRNYEVKKTAEIQLKTFVIQNADVEDLAAKLDPLLQAKAQELSQTGEIEVAPKGGKPVDVKSKVTVQSDRRTNSVIVSAPLAVLNYASDVISVLDVESPKSDKFTAYYQCVNAGAGELANLLNSMFGGASSSTPAATPAAPQEGAPAADARARRAERTRRILQAARSSGGGGDVEIYAVQGDRSLAITTRTEDLLAEVLKRAKELDDMSVSSESVIKRFDLKYSDVYSLADDLIQMFGEAAPKAPAKSSKSESGEDWFSSSWGEVDKGPRIGKDIRIKPLGERKTLVVSAPPAKMVAIEKYIGEVEQIEEAIQTGSGSTDQEPFRIYHPKYLSASDVVKRTENMMDKMWEKSPVTLYMLSKDEVMLTGNPKSCEYVEQEIITRYVDVSGTSSPTVFKFVSTPSNVPVEAILPFLHSYLPDMDIEVQGMGEVPVEGGYMGVKEIK